MSLKILALETSGLGGSVAALAGNDLRQERDLPHRRRSAQTLAPTIREVLNDAGWEPIDVQLVAVVEGPGSFTGLRIGVTTAKAFAYAVRADVLGVCALETIASAIVSPAARIEAVIDAHRRQLFAGAFARRADGQLERLSAPRVVNQDQWLAQLTPGTVVAGPPLASLVDRIPSGIDVAAEPQWHPRAAQAGLLAARKYASGQRGDLWRLAPVYLRPSAAEEKRAATSVLDPAHDAADSR